jgi:mono/diheme cytochrome c family protein
MKDFLKQFTLFVGIFSLFLLVSTESFAGEGNPKAGKAIYITNCALCHGLDGISPVAAATPELHVPNFAKGDRMDKPFEVLFQSVCEGLFPDPPTPPMPPWCKILSEEEIRNALAYVLTFKK